jgi:hypothetical protein
VHKVCAERWNEANPGELHKGRFVSDARPRSVEQVVRGDRALIPTVALFGITEQTATRYVTAAHPERTAKLPEQPAWFSPGGWRASRSAGG